MRAVDQLNFGGIHEAVSSPRTISTTKQPVKRNPFNKRCVCVVRSMSGGETKHGDILCIGEIFESIAGKDEQTLARTLERSSIKTILLFESVYGISPLLHCARTSDMSHLGLVRCLLRSGLCDSETVDSKGRTVLAGLVGAHAQTERTAAAGFLERMIEIVIEGADDSTACYRMLKHNSLPLFKAFLSLKQYDEGRLFECLTCALTKLRVKLFILAMDLELFVLGTMSWLTMSFGICRVSGRAVAVKRLTNGRFKLGL